mmetsp:Transcript_13064/g.33563  ORF Transcript_13064/g.33563 Transcript_13064/m.33563 type:complete len:413 (+) Transcript_13064:635-1873(+)
MHRQQLARRDVHDVVAEETPEVVQRELLQHLHLPLRAVKQAGPRHNLAPDAPRLHAQPLGLLQLGLVQLAHLLVKLGLLQQPDLLRQHGQEAVHTGLHVRGRVGGGLQDEAHVHDRGVGLRHQKHDVAKLLNSAQLVECRRLAELRQQLRQALGAQVLRVDLEGDHHCRVFVVGVGTRLGEEQRHAVRQLHDARVGALRGEQLAGPRAALHVGHLLGQVAGACTRDIPHDQYLRKGARQELAVVACQVLGRQVTDDRHVLPDVPALGVKQDAGLVHGALVGLLVAHVGILARQLLLADHEAVLLDFKLQDVGQHLVQQHPQLVAVPIDRHLEPGGSVAERVVQTRKVGVVGQRVEVVHQQLDPQPREHRRFRRAVWFRACEVHVHVGLWRHEHVVRHVPQLLELRLQHHQRG